MGLQIFSEPQWEQLLPPPLSKEEQRPYTLLLSIDDLLVTSTWDVSGRRSIARASYLTDHSERMVGVQRNVPVWITSWVTSNNGLRS
jgi:hypothetical protein